MADNLKPDPMTMRHAPGFFQTTAGRVTAVAVGLAALLLIVVIFLLLRSPTAQPVPSAPTAQPAAPATLAATPTTPAASTAVPTSGISTPAPNQPVASGGGVLASCETTDSPTNSLEVREGSDAA